MAKEKKIFGADVNEEPKQERMMVQQILLLKLVMN